jgi:hypothetical protein
MPNTKNNSLNLGNLEKVGGGTGKSKQQLEAAGFFVNDDNPDSVRIYVNSIEGIANSDEAKEYDIDRRVADVLCERGYTINNDLLNAYNNMG